MMRGNANGPKRGNGMKPASGAPKINQAELGRMVSEASEKLGGDSEKIKQAIDSGKIEEVTSKLSPNDAKMLNSIMQDENKMKQLLSTPQAQSIIKKLLG